jgi:hypothetical protein
MWNFTAPARVALAGSHTAATRVDVLHSDNPVYTLAVTGGSVGSEADRPVRRNLSCTLTDPTGALSRGDIDDLLDPYECEIQPWRGVMVGGVPELAPHGVFGLTSREVTDTADGLAISLTGQDRSMNYQGGMSSALAISGGTPVETAITRLLATRNRGLNLRALSTGFTCGPLLYAPDIDVWAEAQELAESVGARLFHDREGETVLAMKPPANDDPVTSYEEGDGLLLSINRAEDSDTIRNVVIAESTNGAIRVVIEDTDPTSPTYAGGRYGRRTVAMVNQHFSSVNQARQAASSRLAYELGRSETVSFSAVPDPALDVNEVITVHRPRAGLTRRSLIVASIDMPLSADEPMRVGCRRSVLAPDGRVFAVDAA